MEQSAIDIIIPTYKPDEKLRLLLQRLGEQTLVVHKVILANTMREAWEEYCGAEGMGEFLAALPYELEVFHVRKEEFDHGRTRRLAVARSDAPWFVCMTQDAAPQDIYLLERLLEPMADEAVAASYARQVAWPGCGPVEAYTRNFNYPAEDLVKSESDIPRLGVKTFFCSNVCAAYRRASYDSLGGFEKQTIFNEDMIFAGHAVKAGYKIAYASKAVVLHSHNYSGRQEFSRNFDMAVSQVQHPEVFSGIQSESEGVRMVKNTARHLLTIKKPWLIVELIWQSAWKYMGYRAGKRYGRMSRRAILRSTANPEYWHALWAREQSELEE